MNTHTSPEKKKNRNNTIFIYLSDKAIFRIVTWSSKITKTETKLLKNEYLKNN